MSDQAGEQKANLQPQKGDFIAPPEFVDTDEARDALPPQEEFWRPPVRFGSVPVEKEPLGWDRRRGFRKLFPPVALPFQVVERVSFGHSDLEPNRLFWGDNLHVMRQLPSESVDLIYIDPPFFSGRQYNVIFGDQNELRSFSDIWEGGMPGYLIWLNARLYEMKRLLKRNGSIYAHCDWHASHYIKTEMDKIFGYDNLINEVVWAYRRWPSKSTAFQRFHDIILLYARKRGEHKFNILYQDIADITKKSIRDKSSVP
jgi:adenine specific DNA methylase Mod